MRKIGLISLFILSIIALFSILEPKVSSLAFAQNREVRWNSFISEVKRTQTLDSKAFWQFREFYSPGNFVFDRNGLDAKLVSGKIQSLNLQTNYLSGTHIFLIYSSPYLTSVESPVDSATALNLLYSFTNEKGMVLAKGKDFLIVQNENRVKILFIKTEEEMKQTNGYFDYREDDKDLVKGKYWLSVSEIQL